MLNNEYSVKIIFSSAAIILIILTGYVLHRLGKPYNQILFTFHKLLTVGLIIYAGIFIAGFLKQIHPGFLSYLFLSFSVIAALGLLMSGAFLSLEKYPLFMLQVHRYMSVFFLICITGLFYSIFKYS
ncbi:MAG: hypothetical protein JXR31_11210 [Prolixibacteraceae bacterium]|nr:hypothetical protein [Prolixibacteraceae bacterium]MBN2774811.1 hypothetical protein [Prolixibacteraceae bacterium]